MLCDIITCHVMSCFVKSCDAMSCNVTVYLVELLNSTFLMCISKSALLEYNTLIIPPYSGLRGTPTHSSMYCPLIFSSVTASPLSFNVYIRWLVPIPAGWCKSVSEAEQAMEGSKILPRFQYVFASDILLYVR